MTTRDPWPPLPVAEPRTVDTVEIDFDKPLKIGGPLVVANQIFIDNILQHLNLRETDDPDYPNVVFVVDVQSHIGRLMWVDATSGSEVFNERMRFYGPLHTTQPDDIELFAADGSTVTLQWDETNSRWEFTDPPAGIAEHVDFSEAGTLATKTGTMRWYAPYALTIQDVRASVGIVATGATILVDINKNGTTIFTTQANRPTIAISGNTDVSGVPEVTALAAGDYITMDIDQVGSTIAGSDLVVTARMTQA